MKLFYDADCWFCRAVSRVAALRPGVERVPLDSERAEQFFKGFEAPMDRPYILDGDKLYSGRQMIKKYLGSLWSE